MENRAEPKSLHYLLDVALGSVTGVIGFSAFYGLGSLWLFVQALQGKPFF